MNKEEKQAFLEYLMQFITERRKQLFYEVMNYRTRHITIVLEDIYQSQNASAVLRTAEIYGIQDIHIIENRNQYKINRDVVLGSSKWINLYKYNTFENNTLACFENLREKGYKIYATTPHRDDVNLYDLNLNDKIALVFGSELPGLSKTAMENADGFVKIPMYGFTESFNISVSAAIFLSHLVERLHKMDINWQLSEDERLNILVQWAKNSVRKPELLEREFYKLVLKKY